MSNQSNLTTEPSSVLNIKKSLSGRRWLWKQSSFLDTNTLNRQAQWIAQKVSLYEFIGKMIALRNIQAENVEHFLFPTLRNFLPDPYCLKDMDIATDRIVNAIISNEKIAIFGDYDVDGACATAILYELFLSLGLKPLTYIPDRLKEGYGPNAQALNLLIEQGATVIICVDCGTASNYIFQEIKSNHANFIVFDHHKSDNLPNITATVNPNRLDCSSGLGQLCAGALSFMASIAIIRALRKKHFFTNKKEPNLLSLLDLVALSTICDVMPLIGLNRALVTQGLKIMAKRERIGIQALLEIAGIYTEPDVFSCGFALGPRINAGGRISESDLGLKLLIARNSLEATRIAERLDAINKQRQTIEQDILQKATELAFAQHKKGHAVIMLQDPHWHPGIVGIVAGRIKEHFNRPTLVGAELPNGIVKGSGRSIVGVDLGAAIIAAKQAGLVLQGGGHAMAAGFSYEKNHINELHDFLNHYLCKAASCPTLIDLEIEGVTTIAGASLELAKQIARLSPFGNGNEEPLIVLSYVNIVRSDRIGKANHTLRLTIQGENGTNLKALLFRSDQNPITPYLEDVHNRRPMHLAGWLRVNHWNGKETADFHIKDAVFI